MLARIVWGRISPGQWDAYEAAYRRAIETRGSVPGLSLQWLCRDEADRDAGFDISLWDSRAALTAYVASPARSQVAATLKPFYVNQFTATHCDVRHLFRSYPRPGAGDLDIYHTN
jgi:quinol monooxygenase YgiN